MKFGQAAVVFGPDVIYTPMLPSRGLAHHYWIQLRAISVGNKRMDYILEGDVIYIFMPLLL